MPQKRGMRSVAAALMLTKNAAKPRAPAVLSNEDSGAADPLLSGPSAAQQAYRSPSLDEMLSDTPAAALNSARRGFDPMPPLTLGPLDPTASRPIGHQWVTSPNLPAIARLGVGVSPQFPPFDLSSSKIAQPHLALRWPDRRTSGFLDTAQTSAWRPTQAQQGSQLPGNVDWNFVSEREGGSHTSGYVPLDHGRPSASSGVTIGVGFDLGRRTVADLRRLGFSNNLITTLTPYLNLRGQNAQDYLNAHPLNISQAQAQEINIPSFTHYYNSIANDYNNSQTTGTRFEDLPADAQTPIVSLTYHYGTGMPTAAPHFWRQVTTGDWNGAYSNLLNFGDAYPTRRRLEAGVLRRAIDAHSLPVGH